MNFKIENNFLDITNYPSVERHLEEMASKGWLIRKIILGNIFIYKKIQAEALYFSISPYEIETAFTRKSKEEMEEYQSVCESVGWNYATKSLDLHIYFKEKGAQAIAIQTDEEEEFKTLDLIGQKQVRNLYFLTVPMLLFISWEVLGSLTSIVDVMKDGLSHIAVLFIVVGFTHMILRIVHIEKFLKINRQNIELGKSLQYSDSNFYFHKMFSVLPFILLFAMIGQISYLGILSNRKFPFYILIPLIIGLIVGQIDRIYIKPSKKPLRYKVIAFLLASFIAVSTSIWIALPYIENSLDYTDQPDIGTYRVLLMDDFSDKDIEDWGSLYQNASIFIPKSYGYRSYRTGYEFILTEYSQALIEKLAQILVDQYRKQAEETLEDRYLRSLRQSFKEEKYHHNLSNAGFTIEDFNDINAKEKNADRAIKMAKKRMKENYITKDKENLWNAEQVYFLNHAKTEIVLRKGKEVFYLEGKNFSDFEIINIVKERLELE